VRLPGSGGATEIATSCQKTFIVVRHSPRTLVDRVDFITSFGHGPTGVERRAAGVKTQGPALLVTDLCVMTPDPDTNEFTVISIHPGITRDKIRASTGWSVRFAGTETETPAPTEVELRTLRELNERTARAHGAAAAD